MDLGLIKDVSLLVNAVGAGNCFLLSYVYLRKKEAKIKRFGHVLSFLFFILGAIILNTIFNFTGYNKLLYGFEPLTNALAFAIAPLLFLYVKSNARTTQHFIISSKHLILFHTILILTIIAISAPNTVFGAIGQLFIESEFLRLLWNLHFLAYLVLIFREFRKINNDQRGIQRILVYGIASIWFFNLLFYFYTIWINPLPTIIYLNITLLFSGITLWLFYQKFVVVESRSKRVNLKTRIGIFESLRSDSIIVAIKERKYYKNPNLNIRTLSNELQMPYNELSIRINQEYKQNFNEFINSFRIQEVVDALQTQQHQSYTIMGLAQKAGFKSASAFYAAFKKEKGTTPTLYIEHSVKAL